VFVFDTTDDLLRFISTVGQTTVPIFFQVVIFSGGSKNIAGQTTVPFYFRVVIFLGRNWWSYFDTSTNYGTYIRPEKILPEKRYSHLAGHVFWRVQITTGKITTRKKKSTVVWPTVEIHVFQRVQITTGNNYNLKKKVQSSGQWLK
jgi:hypothetical protein